jgi:hypothetical protein
MLLRTAYLTLTVCIVLTDSSIAQIGENLIRNWNFETRRVNSQGDTSCPSGAGQIHFAKFWASAYGAPSYFNACSNETHPNFGVPWNLFGFQEPYDGEAYSLVACLSPVWPDARQFLFQELEAPLMANQQYRMQFRVNLADSCNFAMSGMGALLSVENTRDEQWQKEDFFASEPQVLNPWENLLADKGGWTLISGTFTAQGGEKYLSIGCFLSDNEDNVQRVSDYPNGPSHSWEGVGYFVDGVELYWDRNIGIDDPENKSIKLYPNPADAIITIETERGAEVMEMFDVSGRGVLHSSLSSPKETIDISHFPSGVYVVAVTLRDGSVHRARLVKQ